MTLSTFNSLLCGPRGLRREAGLCWIGLAILLCLSGCSQMIVGSMEARKTAMPAAERFQEQFNSM